MLKPFFVWHKRALRRIHPEVVAYLETEKNYINMYVPTEKGFTKYMVRTTLDRALKKLPPEIFIRIHRSRAVSIYYIDEITRTNLVIGETPLTIGREYSKSVMKKLTIIE